MTKHSSSLLDYVLPNLRQEGTPKAIDFVSTLWLAGALLLIRPMVEKLALPPLRRWLDKQEPGRGKVAFNVLDNLWIACFSTAFVTMAWFITLFHNGGCTPWSTKPCLEGWPNHPNNLHQRWYMLLTFGYYLYEMIGNVIGVGTKLKPDMVAHHAVTMALVTIAYFINLVRYCCMWTALFDLSNPLLHMAKCMNMMNLRSLETPKWLMFMSFAGSFFVARVLAAPYSIIWPAFSTGFQVLPFSYATTCCILMVFIYGLQLIWFYKIVKIAFAGKAEPGKEE